MTHHIPILEYDPTRQALINPDSHITPTNLPEHCVICFFQDSVDQLEEKGTIRQIVSHRSEMGHHPIYELPVGGQVVALVHPGVGAPLAAFLFEMVIAMGCTKFIACGGAGVLDSGIAMGHLLIPTTAIRDEGTSYHYLPPGREVAASPRGVAAIERTLQQAGVEYLLTKAWTTDGYFRETPDRISRRKSEGCLAVEMEAAALFAVAQFRKVDLAQILYGGDDVGGLVWDHRDWDKDQSIREQLIWLAAAACLDMET
ncbi:MAG TPA: nucleoside phosphorylase [Anaerolineae bacterium]